MPGKGGEQKKRQDEQGRGNIDDLAAVHPGLAGNPEDHQNKHGILEEIIVRSPEELGDEQRQKPPGAKECRHQRVSVSVVAMP